MTRGDIWAGQTMTFGHKFGMAAVLMLLTLMLQCAWIAVLIVWMRARFAHVRHAFGVARAAWLMVWIMANIVVLHLFEILLWGGFYRWRCLSHWESALYFSAANYATVGASEVLVPPEWRAFGPLESLTGVLMCGLSTSFLFAIVAWLVQHDDALLEQQKERQLEAVPPTRVRQ